MKAEVMTVTPGMAREFLRGNTCNRTIKKDVVCKYANDMKNGLWKLGGQGISISRGGRLLDGQHRLNAIILADVPVSMLVCTDVDDDNVNFDNGKSRSITDQYKLRGDNSCIVSFKGIAFIKGCMSFIDGSYKSGMPSKYSFEEFDKFLQANYTEMYEYYNYMMSGNKVMSGIRNSLVFSTMWAIVKLNVGFTKDDYVHVSNVLKWGIVLEEYDSSIIALRDKLISCRFSGSDGRRELLNRCCYAIKKYIEKDPVNKSFITKNLVFDFSKLSV